VPSHALRAAVEKAPQYRCRCRRSADHETVAAKVEMSMRRHQPFGFADRMRQGAKMEARVDDEIGPSCERTVAGKKQHRGNIRRACRTGQRRHLRWRSRSSGLLRDSELTTRALHEAGEPYSPDFRASAGRGTGYRLSAALEAE